MKKYLFALACLMMMGLHVQAQKFLDFYYQGSVVSSVNASDIDSMVIGTNPTNRTIGLYKAGELFHSTTAARVDSVKVFRPENEPLVYLDIIGFNQELYKKEFGILSTSTASGFNTFVGNLTCKDGTLLYYGVDKALEMLKSTSFPTQVSSVNLITFTDGLDQGSMMMNGSYTTDEQYLNAVHQLIVNTHVKGLPLTAYSLGLKGSDVTNYTLFQNNLAKLASSSDKAIEVSSMSAVRTRLQEISDQIISISNKQTVSMKIPGPSNGTIIRFTFDNATAANSSMYIEGTFNLSDRSLRNVKYYGIKGGSGTIVQGKQEGIFVTYTFSGLQRTDGNGLIPVNSIREFYRSSTTNTWQENSEFTPANNTQTNITHSGAIILLVLDCSSSLGSQFSNMKSYAQDFITRVANNAQEYQERPFGNSSDYVNGVAFNMVKVSGGTFQMGATSEQGSYANSNEEPVHQVTLSDYYIGETEVTQELWQAVMGSNPSYYKGAKRPVEQVSWEECQEFIRKLNELTGKQFRLPTEAEWEFAARGGNSSQGYRYSGSNNVNDVAWYQNNTHEVGTKAPNELGLYDMSGNVEEWCQDWYGSYSSSAQTNPTGPTSGSFRVRRGGSWSSGAWNCRVSYRNYNTPDNQNYHLGLRLAL